MDGDVHLKVNGATVPGANLHQLYPNMEFVAVEQLALKVDRLMKRYDGQFARMIFQCDSVIENPLTDPTLKVQAMKTKASLLNSMSNDAARIALTVERQRRMAIEKAKTITQNKAAAIKLLDINRRAAKAGEIDASLANRQPKVRMFMPGAKFEPTVGLNAPEPEF